VAELGITGFLQKLKNKIEKQKKTAEHSAVFKRFERLSRVTQNSLYRQKRLRTRNNQNKTMLGAWPECSTG
jgi:hypothetical protein